MKGEADVEGVKGDVDVDVDAAKGDAVGVGSNDDEGEGGIADSVTFNLLLENEFCLSDHSEGIWGTDGTNDEIRSLSVFVERALDCQYTAKASTSLLQVERELKRTVVHPLAALPLLSNTYPGTCSSSSMSTPAPSHLGGGTGAGLGLTYGLGHLSPSSPSKNSMPRPRLYTPVRSSSTSSSAVHKVVEASPPNL